MYSRPLPLRKNRSRFVIAICFFFPSETFQLKDGSVEECKRNGLHHFRLRVPERGIFSSRCTAHKCARLISHTRARVCARVQEILRFVYFVKQNDFLTQITEAKYRDRLTARTCEIATRTTVHVRKRGAWRVSCKNKARSIVHRESTRLVTSSKVIC